MRRLICMMGLPRSGKSIVAQTLSFHLQAPIVNRDSIRLAMHGQRFVPQAEHMVKAAAELMVRSLFIAGHANVIIDETNTARSRRDYWAKTADRVRCYGDGDERPVCQFLPINTTMEECRRRAISRTLDQELVPVIESMGREWEPLHDDEDAWDLYIEPVQNLIESVQTAGKDYPY